MHVTRVAVVALRHIWPEILTTPLPDEEAAAKSDGLGRATDWVKRQFVRPPEEPEVPPFEAMLPPWLLLELPDCPLPLPELPLLWPEPLP